MLSLGLDSYYFETLRHLNLLQVLQPDISLHASSHLNTPNTPQDYYCGRTKMNSYRDNLWFLLDEWIHDAEIKCKNMMFNFPLLKKNS